MTLLLDTQVVLWLADDPDEQVPASVPTITGTRSTGSSSQAIVEGATLVTADAMTARYDVPVLWG